MRRESRLTEVTVRFGVEVSEIVQDADGVRVRGVAPDGPIEVSADVVFNCTYSRLNHTGGSVQRNLKHEITEMVL